MKPLIAIVGRPNVGKSTLFNRLAGRQLAIVHDQPGVTRDRHYADAYVQGRDLTIVDTGGFEPDSDDPMGEGIGRHVKAAIEEADVIVCVLDGRAPPTPIDEVAVRLLRHSHKPVIYLANRVDSERSALDITELYRLGIEELLPISALHGRGMANFEAALAALLPDAVADRAADAGQQEPTSEGLPPPRLALVGRPNAGKSSLLNALVGDERSLVDHRPGTTRDPVDAYISYRGKEYRIVDTAGIRRRSRVEQGVEAASVMRALRSIDRADVVVFLSDASGPMAEQDARLLGLCMDRARALVVGLNKIDLLEPKAQKKALSQARDVLHFASWLPVLTLSAKSGAGIARLMRAVDVAYRQFHQRVATGELNRFFREVLERHPPPTHGGRAPRLYYLTQAETAPPVFVVISSAPDAVRDSYRRFVANQLRQRFGFDSIPIIVKYRPRRRRERR